MISSDKSYEAPGFRLSSRGSSEGRDVRVITAPVLQGQIRGGMSVFGFGGGFAFDLTLWSRCICDLCSDCYLGNLRAFWFTRDGLAGVYEGVTLRRVTTRGHPRRRSRTFW